MKFRLITLIITLLWVNSSFASLRVVDLRTEGMTNPVGVDAQQLRLSWRTEATDMKSVMQSAYHIMVASTPEFLEQNRADIWDSGVVKSDASLWIPFAGATPRSNQQYFWRVKVYTNKGQTEWSTTASWSMALLGERDWRAQWIGMDRAASWDSQTQWSRLSARYLRKEFQVGKSIRRATAHIAGLGLYELFINGSRVGNQVLAPVPSDYRKAIYYNSYDVTSLLAQGVNAVGVTLGNGRFYTMRQNYKPYKIANFGYPKLRMNIVLEFEDGSTEYVVSDASWRLTADGPIRSNNEYDGEHYNALKELGRWSSAGYDDSKWMAAERVSIPTGTLRAQPMEGMSVVQKLPVRSITKLADKYILDLGQNMAGWLAIKVRAERGDSIRMRFAETLDKNGELYTENLRDALVTDIYIAKGDAQGERWAPRFVYHGFRYVEISGLKYTPAKEDFIGEVVNDTMCSTGELTTSDATLNNVLRNARWGIMGNYKGMPVDCPQRNERQPWLGDRTVGSLGESFLFDNNTLYAKWCDDIRQAQREDGCIPDVAPAYWNYYSDNMTWPAALPMACDMLYTQFGNKEPIVRNYAAIKLWLEHMKKEYMNSEGLITKDKYGDWCVPPESLDMIHSRDKRRMTDGTLIATAYYIKMMQLMERFATLQGLEQDRREFAASEQSTKNAFNDKFFRRDSLFYGNNTATANLLSLAFGIVAPQYAEAVAKKVIANMVTYSATQITTGLIGTQWLMRELSAMGRGDVAFTIAGSSKYPSWGYMAKQGATTIWELWNGNTASPKMNSGNHVMLLGDLLVWSYENLAGISSSRQKVAFKHIILKPDFSIPDLSRVDGSYMTPYGKVVSRWRKTVMELNWQVEIPVNTTAEVHLPNGRVERIGSGSYNYNVAIEQPKGVLVNEFIYEKASFPECHGATIVQTTGGDLVASFFGGTKEANPDCVIWVSRKAKGSDQWSAPVEVANGIQNDTLRKACWNPVLFQVPHGELMLFYKVGRKVSDWSGFVIRSNDAGKSWGKPEALPEGFLGPIKNKPVWVDGKIIAPSSTESNGWKVHFEISDDRGKTWRKVGPIAASPSLPTHLASATDSAFDPEGGGAISATDINSHVVQAIQPSILTHKDGRLQILCRSRNGYIATAWSSDNGETWTPLSLTQLPNNNSGTDAVTLRNGRQVVVYNAVRTPLGEKKGMRTPLNVATSWDGVRWTMSNILESSPISQYSYPSIIEGDDGTLHIVYTWRRQRIKYQQIKQ